MAAEVVSEQAEVVCANLQCKVAEDGRCIEGYELGKCPHYGRRPAEKVQVADDAASGREFDGVRLPDARALDAAGANAHLGLLPTRLIAIVGAYDSGKSCIISGIHDLFQLGPVSGILFAGCSTLHGSERLCHDARVESGREEAHSPRTARGEVRFYHLDVLRDGEVLSLLIADRSGEEYEEVADLADNASGMFELRRANVVTILVDGRRLSSPAERADALGAIPMIVQGMVENGAFTQRPNLAVVLTKGDIVAASPKADRARRDFDGIVSRLKARFSAHIGELESFVTCASPKDAKAVRGLGLPELLQFWTKAPVPASAAIRRSCSGRVFDMLEASGGDLG